MDQKIVNRIGWFASFMAVLMFSSYIDQIRLNIGGSPGSVVLPIATTINCSTWVLYGYLKQKRDWQLMLCNAFGAVIGVVTAFTAVV